MDDGRHGAARHQRGLAPIDDSARSLAYNAALGRRYFWNQLAAGVLLLAMSLAPFFARPGRSYGAVSTPLFARVNLFSIILMVLAAAIIINSAIQIWRIGKRDGRGVPTTV